MAGKSDSGDGSGERASAPPWNAGETEMLRNLFLEEAEKHLGRIAEAQKLLSRATSSTLDISPDVVDVLFRHLHTLKGSAGSVGFDSIARAAHELEELCTEIRRGQLAPTFGILERIDEGVAEIRALLTSARLSVPPPRSSEALEAVPNPKEMVDRRRSNDRRIVADRRGGGEGVLRVDVERLDALLRSVGDLVILRTRLDRRVHEMRSVLRDLGATRNGVRTAQGSLTGGAKMEETSRLLDRLGEVDVELTDTLSYLDRTARRLTEDAESMRATSDELEEQIRRARLVPLEWAYSRLGSALHELERTCHRQADLLVHGGEIELDKAIVDQLADPLLHLLRNSMAHGIESAPVRAERGKPARGRITIRASQEADFVFLTFEDDGGGIDRDAIQANSSRRGPPGRRRECQRRVPGCVHLRAGIFHARAVRRPGWPWNGHEHRQARGLAPGRRDQGGVAGGRVHALPSLAAAGGRHHAGTAVQDRRTGLRRSRGSRAGSASHRPQRAYQRAQRGHLQRRAAGRLPASASPSSSSTRFSAWNCRPADTRPPCTCATPVAISSLPATKSLDRAPSWCGRRDLSLA
jgi:chemotaxis protein histidine kinase CheA